MQTSSRSVRAKASRPPLVTPRVRDDVVLFDPMRAPAAEVVDPVLADAVDDVARSTTLVLSMSLQRPVGVQAGSVSRQRASSLPAEKVVWLTLDCGSAGTGAVLLPIDMVAGLGELIMGGSALTGRAPSAVEVKLVCDTLMNAVKRWAPLAEALGLDEIAPGSPGVGPASLILEGKEITTVPLDISVENLARTIVVCLPQAPALERDALSDSQAGIDRIASVHLVLSAQLPAVTIPLADLQQMRVGSTLATGIYPPCVVDLVSGDQVLAAGALTVSGNQMTVSVEHLERKDAQ